MVDHHRSSGSDVLASKHGDKGSSATCPSTQDYGNTLAHKQAGQQPSQTGWLLSHVCGAKTTQEDVPTSRADLDRNGHNSSSETQSDPLIHGNAGASRHEFDEISSDETISDD